MPGAAEDAEIFFRKLDPARFSEMNTALDNQAALGMNKPATVEKAYQVASTWKTAAPQRDNRRGRDDTQSVMAVLTDEVRPCKRPNLGRDEEQGGAGRDGGRGGGRDGGHGGGRDGGRGRGRDGGRGRSRGGHTVKEEDVGDATERTISQGNARSRINR